MSPGVHDDTIPAELEKSCAQEPIHLLGTVQSYGFLMVVDIASGCIVQVSAGIVQHWPGLQDAAVLLSRPLADVVAAVDGPDPRVLDSLPVAHPVALPWRPRFEQTGAPQALPGGLTWECLGHRCGAVAVIEWLPVEACPDELRRQHQIFADFAEMIAGGNRQHADRGLVPPGSSPPPPDPGPLAEPVSPGLDPGGRYSQGAGVLVLSPDLVGYLTGLLEEYQVPPAAWKSK